MLCEVVRQKASCEQFGSGVIETMSVVQNEVPIVVELKLVALLHQTS